MDKTMAWLLAALFATAPRQGIACGVCIDDKVAAVYDHAIVQRALTTGRVVVFCEVAGPRQPDVLAPQLRRAARGLPGVDPASVRASEELPVLSFALDPAARTPAAAVDELRARLEASGVAPTLLKVMAAPVRN